MCTHSPVPTAPALSSHSTIRTLWACALCVVRRYVYLALCKNYLRWRGRVVPLRGAIADARGVATIALGGGETNKLMTSRQPGARPRKHNESVPVTDLSDLWRHAKSILRASNAGVATPTYAAAGDAGTHYAPDRAGGGRGAPGRRAIAAAAAAAATPNAASSPAGGGARTTSGATLGRMVVPGTRAAASRGMASVRGKGAIDILVIDAEGAEPLILGVSASASANKAGVRNDNGAPSSAGVLPRPLPLPLPALLLCAYMRLIRAPSHIQALELAGRRD